MKRRTLLAVAFGAATATGAVGVSLASTFSAETTDPLAVEPVHGAGIFDVDPDQRRLSQDPTIAVVGDVDALPDDMEL